MTGLAGLQAAADQQKAKQAAFLESNGEFVKYARFPVNEIRVIRFLEQGDDVQWAWVHECPAEQGRKWGGSTPCLNQDGRGQACPGCELGAKRKIAGWINIIMRDADVYEKDADGRAIKNPLTQQFNVIGQADQVFVWQGGSRVFTTLGQKDRSFKGLMSRDFEVIRTGEGLGTNYSIEPADVDSGPQPMSKADLKLAAAKPDTKKFTLPESYDIAKQLLQGVPRASIQRSSSVQQAAGLNIFTRAMEEGA